jgi:hypothetical protein
MSAVRAYRLIVLVLLVACAVLLIWRPLEAHDDFYAHATVGWWIWQHKAVPHETLLLWTDSRPWVYHSWLTQVTFYALSTVENYPPAVMAFTIVLGLAPFVLAGWLFVRSARDSTWMAIPVVLLLQSGMARIQPRPDLFSAAALALLVLLLSRFPAEPGKAKLALLPLLMAVWANFHGAVLLGLLILGVTVVCDAIQDRLDRRSRWLAMVFLLSLAAVHLNPYGFRYWTAFAALDGYVFSRLLEWQPVWTEPYPPLEWQVGALVSTALALVAWIGSPPRRLSQLAWVLLGAALFVRSRRNVSVLVVLDVMVVALNARALQTRRVWEFLTGRGRWANHPDPPLRWVFRLGVVCFLAGAIASRWLDLPPDRSMIPDHLEDGAVAFVRDRHLQGRAFNDLDSSAYLHFRCRDRLPLFIDTLNAYRDDLLRDYFAILRGNRRSHQLIDGYGVNVVILTVERMESSAVLAAKLDADREWARVYADRDGVIWVRQAEFAELLAAVGRVSSIPFATLERWRGKALAEGRRR